jgi:hypothetical protein
MHEYQKIPGPLLKWRLAQLINAIDHYLPYEW